MMRQVHEKQSLRLHRPPPPMGVVVPNNGRTEFCPFLFIFNKETYHELR